MNLLLIISTPAAFELIKNAIILIQNTQLVAQVVMDTVRFHGPILHVQVPNLDVQIVPGAQVATRVTELHVRYTTDNLGEEVLGRRVLPLLKYFKHSFLLSKKSQRLVTAQTT